MKNSHYLAAMALAAGTFLVSCNDQNEDVATAGKVPESVLAALTNAGFNVTSQAPIVYKDGYLVEGDIYLLDTDIATLKEASTLPNEEQYR